LSESGEPWFFVVDSPLQAHEIVAQGFWLTEKDGSAKKGRKRAPNNPMVFVQWERAKMRHHVNRQQVLCKVFALAQRDENQKKHEQEWLIEGEDYAAIGAWARWEIDNIRSVPEPIDDNEASPFLSSFREVMKKCNAYIQLVSASLGLLLFLCF
jgi:hypothetical protein